MARISSPEEVTQQENGSGFYNHAGIFWYTPQQAAITLKTKFCPRIHQTTVPIMLTACYQH